MQYDQFIETRLLGSNFAHLLLLKTRQETITSIQTHIKLASLNSWDCPSLESTMKINFSQFSYALPIWKRKCLIQHTYNRSHSFWILVSTFSTGTCEWMLFALSLMKAIARQQQPGCALDCRSASPKLNEGSSWSAKIRGMFLLVAPFSLEQCQGWNIDKW